VRGLRQAGGAGVGQVACQLTYGRSCQLDTHAGDVAAGLPSVRVHGMAL
jgi:hypothetical protein